MDWGRTENKKRRFFTQRMSLVITTTMLYIDWAMTVTAFNEAID
jgi:hypothetical protein